MSEMYLPKVLDQALNNLALDYGLTGWRIYSGICNATETIKFGDPSQNNTEEHVSGYRKIPPSAYTRDRRRMDTFNADRQPQSAHARKAFMTNSNTQTVDFFESQEI